MRRLLYVYLAVFSFVIMGFSWMIRTAPRPDQVILGHWREAGWHYERVYKKEDESVRNILSNRGNQVAIHKAETWSFLPGGQLVLAKDGRRDTISWCIKSRGNILELTYGDGRKEHYDLTNLSSEQMILNFEMDTQIKGLAKLTFERLR